MRAFAAGRSYFGDLGFTQGLMSFPIIIVAGALLGLGEPAQRRTCPVATVPAQLPAVPAVVDVVALRVALDSLLAEAPAVGDMVFSVRFKKDGEDEWVKGISAAADVSIHEAAARIISGHLKNPGPAPEPWSFRLHVIPADTVQFRVSRSEVCPVERVGEADAPIARTLTFRVAGSSAIDEIRRARDFAVIVEVSSTGKVATARIREGSGSRIMDEQALRAARLGRYRPALVDGIPVAGRYEMWTRTRVGGG